MPATIEIRESLEKNAGSVLTDPTQISQVMMNLGTNAYHAMLEGGGILEVRLEGLGAEEMEALKIPGIKEGPCVRLRVKDSGIGLAVVHGIVKTHGGAITVDSQPGRGSQV